MTNEKDTILEQVSSAIQKIKAIVEEKIKKLDEQIKEDLKIEHAMISIENRDNPSKYHRYVTLHRDEKRKLADIKRSRDELYGTLWEKFKYKDNRTLETKTQIEPLIFKHPKWVIQSVKYDEQKVLVDYLSDVVGIFNQRSYTLSNCVKILEIDLGKKE